MKRMLVVLVSGLVLTGFQAVAADDCVQVDIELPDTVVAIPGAIATGYFELINCGDEDAVITLDIEIQLGEIPISLPGIPVPMGAGKVIAREFVFPAPPAIVGNTVTICITATSGSAVETDCASVTFVDGGGLASTDTDKQFGFSLASSSNCVNVDLELPDTVVAEPASFATGYLELTNCSDEWALVELAISVEMFDTSITIPGPAVPLDAGEMVSREFRFPIPPIVPAGTYVVCVTATAGDAVETACQTVVITNSFGPSAPAPTTQNYPNPFNPSTSIYFELPTATHVNLSIYNVLGQRVVTVHDGALSAGKHVFEWEGTDDANRELASGVYFYRLQTGDVVQTRKMLMVR